MKELIKPAIESPENEGLYEALCEVHIIICDCNCSKSKFFADDDQSDIIF